MSTPDVAQRSVRSSAASRARSFNIARGVAAAAAAFVILVGTASVDRLLAVFWRFELAFGFVLQRSRFCFASAFLGAVHLGWKARKDADNELYVIPAEKLAGLMGQQGISTDTTVVAYDDQGGLGPARFW